jgi:hypothetical protein
MVLLLDARWKEAAYARLFPQHRRMSNTHTLEQIRQAAVAFWASAEHDAKVLSVIALQV